MEEGLSPAPQRAEHLAQVEPEVGKRDERAPPQGNMAKNAHDRSTHAVPVRIIPGMMAVGSNIAHGARNNCFHPAAPD